MYGLSVHCFSGVLRVHYERFESEPRYRTMSVNDAGTNTAAAAYSPVQSLEKRIELKTKYKSILEACISQNVDVLFEFIVYRTDFGGNITECLQTQG